MAKNKAKAQPDEELITKDEVSFEEVEQGGTTASGASGGFFQKYRNILIIGGVGVLVAGIFMVLRMSGRESANLAGQAAMVPAVLQYEQDSFNVALNGGASVQNFQQIIDEYGNSDAGELAKYYAGTAYLQTGNLDLGLEMLEDYSKGKTMVSAAAYAAIGYAHEQKGSFDEAAKAYETAARTPSENSFSTPFYLMQAARNLESAGNNEGALAHYRTIREKYPLSQEGAGIDKYIAKLSPEDE